jgi:hypothetical protein
VIAKLDVAIANLGVVIANHGAAIAKLDAAIAKLGAAASTYEEPSKRFRGLAEIDLQGRNSQKTSR